ncbi:hypothetical protein FHT08_000173 [Xanthomonas campestris]|nr:hypothetical protein [Xanthomonas sp. CFBP 8151]
MALQLPHERGDRNKRHRCLLHLALAQRSAGQPV